MSRPGPVPRIACWVVLLSAVAPTAQAQDRFAARLELGAGSMLSAFQRNHDPTAYGGEAKGLGLGLHGGLRLAWSVTDALALQVSLSNWIFTARDRRESAWVFAPMVGLRIEPAVGSVGRLFVDGNVGLAMTGDVRTVQVDVGAGFEFRVAAALAVGPVVRYGHTVQPDTRRDGQAEPYPDDARYVVGGLSMSFGTNSVAAPSRPPETARDRDHDGVSDDRDVCPDVARGASPDGARTGCPTVDVDRDGVPDAVDLCPTVAPGEHPDESRRGCPVRDRDDDGVTDDRDVCVDVAQGPNADPLRAGCPDPDRDHDGVTDHDDACPDEAAGPAADPTRRGCPDGDRDGDGYLDSRDRCPGEAETFNNVTDEDGCPEVLAPTVEIRSGMIQLQGNPVNFITGSDRIIGRRSFETLDALVAVLRAHVEITRVDIQGHTDDRGDRAANTDLSARRARAVRTYLIDHGILPDRVEAHGFGPDRAVADNGTAEGRATNRRVEVHIVSVLPGAATQTR